MLSRRDDFIRQVEAARQRALAQIASTPVAALVWGPSPHSADPLAAVRVRLRDELRALGHYAEFSEDLYDPSLALSNVAQQVAQAEAFDVVFSLPSSHGAVGEIHDFARLRGISQKVIGFVDSRYVSGYSSNSLIAAQASSTCKIEVYDVINLPNCILNVALGEVKRLQELFYMAGRR